MVINFKNLFDTQSKKSKLSDFQAYSIEGFIKVEEATSFLSKMKNDKSPRSSGFSVEFFKFFWRDLKFSG